MNKHTEDAPHAGGVSTRDLLSTSTDDSLTDVKARLNAVYARVRALVLQTNPGQTATDGVKILAVSKFIGGDVIQDAYNVGQRDFGENYVDELVDKASRLPADIRWHFIGHLQSNKCNSLLRLRNLYRVSSLGSVKLAEKLQNGCQTLHRTLDVLVQVNVSGEVTKSGVQPEDVMELATYILNACPNLCLRGLLVIGVQHDKNQTRVCFQKAAQLKQELLRYMQRHAETMRKLPPEDLVLSMGMTDDMDDAIQLGSTEVRVGTAIFGPRVDPRQP